MKTIKYFAVAVLGLAVLAACNKDNSVRSTKSISIMAEIGAMSKVAYSGNEASFEAGDNLSLFSWTGDKTVIPAANLVVNNVKNTLGEDGKWAPAVQMKWADMITDHYFMAVSPAREVKSFTADEYILDPSAAKFLQSDLLVAVNDAGLKANDNPVQLVFDHMMAKLNVNIAFRNQWTEGNPPSAPNTEAKVAAVHATAKDHAAIDYIHKSITANGNNAQVAMNKVENASWTTLMIPQAGFRTISITLAGNDEWLGGNGVFVYEAPEDIRLESGKITTVNLIIGRDQISLAENGINITNWTDGWSYDGEILDPQDE